MKKLFAHLTRILPLLVMLFSIGIENVWGDDLPYFNAIAANNTTKTPISSVTPATAAGGIASVQVDKCTTAESYVTFTLNASVKTIYYSGVTNLYLCFSTDKDIDMSLCRASNANLKVVAYNDGSSTTNIAEKDQLVMSSPDNYYSFKKGTTYYISTTSSSGNTFAAVRAYFKQMDDDTNVTVKGWWTSSIPSAPKTQWDAPTFTVGAWDKTNMAYPVTIAAEEGASIQYSLDGTSYSTYSAAVNVAAEATIYAKATGTGYSDSEVASKTMEAAPASYIVKAVLNGGKTAPTVDGSIGGTGTANTQSKGSDNGYKLGSDGYYVGITLANSEKFKAGDLLNVHITTAAQSGTITLYKEAAGTNVIYNTGVLGVVGDNKITLPADIADYGTFYIVRLDASNKWNASLDYIQVDRPDSYSLDGVKVDGEALATNKYSVANNVITFTNYYTIAPTVTLTQKGTFEDETSTSVDVPVTLTKSGGNFTGTAAIGSTTYTVNVPVKAISAAPEFTTNLEATYAVAKASTKELTIVATDAESYQWYRNTTSSTESATAIDGATSASYTYTGTTKGTEYIYCVATNTIGSTTSTIAAITTLGSSNKLLTAVKYSNGFNAFITDPTDEANGAIKAYYMDGETAPTISSAVVSDDASYAVSDNILTVTAEDGSTAAYDITLAAVTPYTGAGVQFDGTESWIKTGGAYNTKDTYYAWVINRQLKTTESYLTDNRERSGRTRIYFFVDAAKSITLINDRGTALSATRNIKVYVNGVEQTTPTSMPAYDKTTPASITITTGSAAMIEITSNQNSGDTGWGKITVDRDATISSIGWASLCLPYDATIPEGVKAYYASVASTNTITLKEIFDAIPANEGVVISGTAGTYSFDLATSATAITGNLFEGTLVETNLTENENYVLAGAENSLPYFQLYANSETGTGTIKLAAYKAYLPASVVSNAPSRVNFIVEDSEIATATENIENSEDVVKFFENGQLFIKKNGAVYNALGQVVK